MKKFKYATETKNVKFKSTFFLFHHSDILTIITSVTFSIDRLLWTKQTISTDDGFWQAVCIQVGYSGGESSFGCLSHYSSKRIMQWKFFKPLQNWKKNSAVCYLLFLKPNFERPRVLVALRRSALNSNRHSPSLLRRWNTSVAIN